MRNWLRRLRLNRFLVPFVCASLFAVGFALQPVLADDKADKKEEKKPEPPRVSVALPLALKSGVTNQVIIRGQNLTNVTALNFTNEVVKATVVLGKRTKAEVPKEADARKVGDTQVTVEILLPADAPAGTNWFVLASPDGISEPAPILFLPAGQVIEEKEPNGGFREAQALPIGQTMSGTIKETGDVDVFRFQGVAGQVIRLEVVGAAVGSALDSLMTLYDGNDQRLASNDDAHGGRDSFLETRLAATGVHYVSVMDANDKGGPIHVYLLRIVSLR